MNSRRNCQYGENCYRKNPVHFKEYCHPHLENILRAGVNETTKSYEIPANLFMSTDIVKTQLSILENIFPQLKPDKRPNSPEVSNSPSTSTESDDSNNIDTPLTSSTTNNIDTPSTTFTTNNIDIPSTSSTTKEDNVDDEVEIVEEKIEVVNLDESFEEESQKRPSSSSITPPSPKKRVLPNWTTPSKDSNKNEKTSPRTSKKEEENVNNQENLPSTSNSTESLQDQKKPRIDRNIHDYISVVLPKGKMAEKLKNAAPYNFFLTTITSSKLTHSEPLSITLQEILDESLGEIESTFQMNFMVDIGWLLGHYYFAGCLDKQHLILYGDDSPELRNISKTKPKVTAIKVNMPSAFATHHTKMMIFNYTDNSMRIVISTANLYEDDWYNRTQGIWISPRLPPLKDDSNTNAGDSVTNFKQDLMLYLVEYKISNVQPWIARIRKTDFSSINVFFVASAPGGFRQTSVRGHPFGHARVGQLLGKHAVKIDESVPVVAQSSSIGSLGPNAGTWIESDILNSFRKDSTPLGIRRLPQFKMIYPSYSNVKQSHDDLLGGGCLPYTKNTNDKQPWLRNYLYQWRAKSRNRNQAMPHIKTYCRWNENDLYWFVLTSANLSKAAWGAFNKGAKIEPNLRIYNYEAGVLFLPRIITGEDTFPLNKDRDGVPQFPMPYDIPLHPYGADDKPFLMDYLMQ